MVRSSPWMFRIDLLLGAMHSRSSDSRSSESNDRAIWRFRAGGGKFRGFGGAILNNNGSVLMMASVDLEQNALWTDEAGFLRQVAVSGDAIPGYSNRVGAFFTFSMNDRGDIVFGSIANGNGGSGFVGTLPHGSIGFQPYAVNGDPVPQTQQSFSVVQAAQVNSQGNVVFGALISPVGQGGVFEIAPPDLQTIVRTSTPAPDLPGLTVRSIGLTSWNDRGQVALSGQLVQSPTTGVNSSNDEVFWVGQLDQLNTVYREGNPAAGLPDSFYEGHSGIRFNASGQFVFEAGIKDSQQVHIGSALYIGDDDGLQLLFAPGQEAPGTSGLWFLKFDTPSVSTGVVLNSHGEVAFAGTLTDGGGIIEDRVGIWSTAFGGLHMIARMGQPAPGTDGTFSTLESPKMNGRGTVVFQGALALSDTVTSQNDLGIWAEGPDGVVRLLVREGDWLQVAPSDEHRSPLSVNITINREARMDCPTHSMSWTIWLSSRDSLTDRRELSCFESCRSPTRCSWLASRFLSSLVLCCITRRQAAVKASARPNGRSLRPNYDVRLSQCRTCSLRHRSWTRKNAGTPLTRRCGTNPAPGGTTATARPRAPGRNRPPRARASPARTAPRPNSKATPN